MIATLTRKDVAATVLTALAVLAFAATHESWGVPLVGDSRRWAAGAILLLGVATCSLGSPSSSGRGVTAALCATLGTAALVLGVLALATASLTLLSLLVADIVALWAISTLRHARHAPRTPVTA